MFVAPLVLNCHGYMRYRRVPICINDTLDCTFVASNLVAVEDIFECEVEYLYFTDIKRSLLAACIEHSIL